MGHCRSRKCKLRRELAKSSPSEMLKSSPSEMLKSSPSEMLKSSPSEMLKSLPSENRHTKSMRSSSSSLEDQHALGPRLSALAERLSLAPEMSLSAEQVKSASSSSSLENQHVFGSSLKGQHSLRRRLSSLEGERFLNRRLCNSKTILYLRLLLVIDNGVDVNGQSFVVSSSEAAPQMFLQPREFSRNALAAFPGLRWTYERGNNDLNDPRYINVWGLRWKTPAELAQEAEVAFFSNTQEDAEQIAKKSFIRTWNVEQSPFIGEIAVGLNTDLTHVRLLVKVAKNNSFTAYGATIAVLTKFRKVKCVIIGTTIVKCDVPEGTPALMAKDFTGKAVESRYKRIGADEIRDFEPSKHLQRVVKEHCHEERFIATNVVSASPDEVEPSMQATDAISYGVVSAALQHPGRQIDVGGCYVTLIRPLQTEFEQKHGLAYKQTLEKLTHLLLVVANNFECT